LGKYAQLGNYLRNNKKKVIKMEFSEIVEILGFSLPNSAYTHRAWWANDENHVQAFDGWISSGYHSVDVDLDNHLVSFKGVRASSHKPFNINEFSGKGMTAKDFERFAQMRMSEYFGVDLNYGKKDDWPKLFDLVSKDYGIVGDAKYFSMVRGKFLPSAKLSVISEHVWMLEKIDADKTFLVFGNDIRVPQAWLKRFGRYINSVEFYFLSNDGKLTILEKAD